MAKTSYDAAKLKALGSFGEDGTAFDKNLTGMEEACGKFIERVVDNIKKKGLTASGEMQDITVQKVDKTTLQIFGMYYIPYVDQGVQGTKVNLAPMSPFKMKQLPPSSAFVKWMVEKGMKIDPTKINSVGFAMARKRQNVGVAPKDFFEKELDQLAIDAGNGVSKALINKYFNKK